MVLPQTQSLVLPTHPAEVTNMQSPSQQLTPSTSYTAMTTTMMMTTVLQSIMIHLSSLLIMPILPTTLIQSLPT